MWSPKDTARLDESLRQRFSLPDGTDVRSKQVQELLYKEILAEWDRDRVKAATTRHKCKTLLSDDLWAD